MKYCNEDNALYCTGLRSAQLKIIHEEGLRTFYIFIFLLAAHILGDVIFGSHKLAILKRGSGFLTQMSGQMIHGLIQGFMAGVMLYLCPGEQDWLKGAVFLFCIHVFIDLIRSNTEKRLFGPGKVHVKRSEFFDWIRGKTKDPEKMNFNNLKIWLLINIVDQASHIISLYAITQLIR